MHKLYRAAAPFVWVDPTGDPSVHKVFHEGIILRGDHPAVLDKPSCFVECDELDVQSRIEQTRANPGELSEARRGPGRPPKS